ncbi:MAG: DNA alkylation repair protein [Bacteroidota bacterium]|nr:DNA alkylation repair protein [Bacteroidota bacterium]
MEFLLDDQKTEKHFQDILRQLVPLQNGVVAHSMKERGILYKVNLGASIVDLRKLAKYYTPDHLLALKLWNKGWRETKILATLLEVPEELSEEQMDYWVRSFESTELAEQAVLNLFPRNKFAYVKALEWCRGKKFLVKYTGLLLMGRLAFTDHKAPDEMFEPFFDVLPPLTKDSKLSEVFYRTFGQLGRRSIELNKTAIEFAHFMKTLESEAASLLADQILEELQSDWVQAKLKS